jgi:acyl-CoA reductase-like NAD-dependent aldehyde dehydrogenase
MRHQSNWVSGAYQLAAKEVIQVINPATESAIATIDSTPLDSVNSIIASSLENFSSGVWSRADASTRFAVLSKAANLLRSRLPEFINLETKQTGRPIREMKAQLSRIPE